MTRGKGQIRAAIVGCGRIAGWLEDDARRGRPSTHAGAYQAVRATRLVACASRTLENAEAFAKRFGIPAAYDDFAQMLDEQRPDLLSICTPAEVRLDLVRAAAAAGVRGIFCEKALATSLAEADEIVGLCRAHHIAMAVNHSRRWCWDFRALKQFLDEGALGALQSVRGAFGGHIIHTGTHFFDALLWLVGPAQWVEATTWPLVNPETGDTIEDGNGVATIRMAGGAYAHVDAIAKDYFLFELDLLGSHGRVRIGNNGVLERYESAESRHYNGFRELRRVPFASPPEGETNPYVLAVRELVDAIEGNGRTSSTANDGRAALEVALAVFESGGRGGERVELPLANRRLCIVSK
ncbi:MAG: Gfo/Idh/MocA family oxidoreductase [Verrucomicrobia bacterium]|nr:Gfo/Idh/MocA family oxidoreductase [Verrucomicrobiota bacterium]